MTTSLARSRGVQLSRAESASARPNAPLLDTLVLLLAIGAIVVVCGLVTLLVLHPISGRAVAERILAIVATS